VEYVIAAPQPVAAVTAGGHGIRDAGHADAGIVADRSGVVVAQCGKCGGAGRAGGRVRIAIKLDGVGPAAAYDGAAVAEVDEQIIAAATLEGGVVATD